MISMFLDLAVGFLKCVLSDGPTVEAVKIFSLSFLVSKLLLTTIAHLAVTGSVIITHVMSPPTINSCNL